MSHRPGSFSEHPRTRGHEQARHGDRPAPQPQRLHHGTRENGYTLSHAGKRVRIGPVLFWGVVGSVIVMGAWSAATVTYFTFRDDVLTRLVARQAEMQYAYEDRIAELRAQIDRTTSRQLLDQEQFEQKLDQIQRRQISLEQRTSALGGLPDTTPTGSVRAPGRGAALADPITTGSINKPTGVSDTVVFVAPPDREARLESRTTAFANLLKPGELSKTAGVGNVLTRLNVSLDGVEGRQLAALNTLEENYDSRMRRMRGVFSDLGLNLADMETRVPSQGGVGGPFVPAKPARDAGPFERQLYRINLTRSQIDRLNRTLAVVPYRKPVIGQVEFSSGFGIRSDPFLGRPAMHTGLDFRASTGDPVRATAYGKVIAAGWQGGYGKMVEIDHGNTLSTRYGHLSEINVKIGDIVRIGQVIGAVGSTGRSTGPHLHYETRIDGDAVDPQKFLRAGVRLGSS
jgi:murein DD-endopeptidase MepM/ murein hydrolase activator NlpD